MDEQVRSLELFASKVPRMLSSCDTVRLLKCSDVFFYLRVHVHASFLAFDATALQRQGLTEGRRVSLIALKRTSLFKVDTGNLVCRSLSWHIGRCQVHEQYNQSSVQLTCVAWRGSRVGYVRHTVCTDRYSAVRIWTYPYTRIVSCRVSLQPFDEVPQNRTLSNGFGKWSFFYTSV